MQVRPFEDFLNPKLALKYSIRQHSFMKVLREVFSGPAALHSTYSKDIAAVEHLLANLAASIEALGPRRAVSKRGSTFLRLRTNGMEVWSSICTAFGALFAAASAWFVATSNFLSADHPYHLTIPCALIATFFLVCKLYIDRRVHWYRYVVACLDAIAANEI